MNQSELGKVLAANNIPDYRYFDTIDSTNNEAIKWINKSSVDYSIVLANSQTSGRGRQNRNWITTPGASLAISIILHPNKGEIEKLGLFSLLGGLAVRNTCDKLYSIDAKVKWPNDVLIDDKKTAGILAEGVWDGSSLKGLVLGVGINLYKEAIPADDTLIYPATCVQDHSSVEVNGLDIIDCLLKTIKELRTNLLTEVFHVQYIRKMAFIHEKVVLRNTMQEDESGLLVGIDQYGNLQLEDENSQKKTFPVGDISLRKG